MAVPIQTRFPASITAGDTARIQLLFGDYPASAWTAALKLNQAGGAVINVAGTASADSFLFVITSAVSANMASGLWTWAARVIETATGDVATAQAGDFQVLADYSGTVEKTITQQQLDAANAALLILVADPDATVSFNGQTMTSANKAELIGVIDRLTAKVAQENAAVAGLRGDAPSRSIRPYFV